LLDLFVADGFALCDFRSASLDRLQDIEMVLDVVKRAVVRQLSHKV